MCIFSEKDFIPRGSRFYHYSNKKLSNLRNNSTSVATQNSFYVNDTVET